MPALLLSGCAFVNGGSETVQGQENMHVVRVERTVEARDVPVDTEVSPAESQLMELGPKQTRFRITLYLRTKPRF